MVFFATSLLMISGLKIAGGILLLWIGAKLILDNNKENIINVSQEKNLIGAIRTIIIADFVMSLDNSVAIAAAADGNMYLVLFGLLLSIPIIIWGSSFILKLIDKFPIIIYLGSALLGWIAGDMILTDIFITENFKGISNYSILPILGSLSVLTFCFLYKIIKK
jgi:YjbE family integral membrane protein